MSLVIIILLLGLLASLSPSTIVVFILLLATTRARANAAAFLIGWSLSLTVVFAATYLLGGEHTFAHGGGRVVVEILEVLLGLGLVVVAVRQWLHRDRPRTGSGAAKGLTSRLKELNPWEAAIVGVLEQPWTLTAAAAVVVVRHDSALVIAVIAFLVFTVASTATVGLTFLYFARRPGEAEAHLATLRDRLVRAGPIIFAAVSTVVGLYLIADGLLALV